MDETTAYNVWVSGYPVVRIESDSPAEAAQAYVDSLRWACPVVPVDVCEVDGQSARWHVAACTWHDHATDTAQHRRPTCRYPVISDHASDGEIREFYQFFGGRK